MSVPGAEPSCAPPAVPGWAAEVPGTVPRRTDTVAEPAWTAAAPPAPPLPVPAARTGEERPPLPRRRAQEHLAPQLREAPAPRATGVDQPVHDPGLMAAFQRGFGLAQSEHQK